MERHRHTYTSHRHAQQLDPLDQQSGPVHELLIRQRTQLVNALRGHATEFGVTRRKERRDWRGCKATSPRPMRASCRRRRRRC